MVAVLATVRLPALNGNPADDVINDFAFNMAAFTASDADDIAGAIESFYNTTQVVPGLDGPVAAFISGAITRAQPVVIDLYNITGFLSGAPHGSPTYQRSFTLGATAITINYPTEVAITASFHADLDGVLEVSGATRPAARRRGRIYLGPTGQQAATPVSGQPYVSQDAQDIIAAASLLLSGALSSAWSVWSRADAVLRPVVGGWVDNAFDTQRRRGPKFNARTIWSD